MLEVHNITKHFGQQCALHDVSFAAPKGQILGFLGPNGAGKSTLMRIITGFTKPDSGYCVISGQRNTTNHYQWRKSIGYLPEHNPLYTDMYVKEFLQFTAGLFNISNRLKLVNQLIDKTGLGPEQHKKIKQLSKGYRQRVGLAQALIHDPEVLILDEPTTGLDPNQIVQIRTLIKELGAQKTIMFSTHIMQEVEALCDRVIIIRSGKLVADSTLDALKIGNKMILHVQLQQAVPNTFWTDFTAPAGIHCTDNKGICWNLEFKTIGDWEVQLFKYVASKGAVLTRLERQEMAMEQWFRSQTLSNE
jgi:ABC-2 type transport system ATP-binding protein